MTSSKMLESQKDYWYLMDSQTVPLEDYLSRREPRQAGKFVKNARQDRPCFPLPRSTTSTAIDRAKPDHGPPDVEEFGGNEDRLAIRLRPGVADAADLPGVRHRHPIFYRGIGVGPPKSEFIWEADGSRARLAARLQGYSFYFDVWRPSLTV
jgi:hypothetical protein